jgi:hypothetical protein
MRHPDTDEVERWDPASAVDRMAVMPDRFAGDWPVILKLARPLGAAARAPEAR